MTKATTAIAFAERGWHILPVAPYQKTPFFPIATHGYKSATTDIESIEKWFTRAPMLNIGIACAPSNLVVFDIDYRNGGTTEGLNLDTFTVATGDGLHLYYTAPADAKFKGKLREGVDIKHNGYVVGAGSLHESGKFYEVVKDIQPAPMMEWIWVGGMCLQFPLWHSLQWLLAGSTSFGQSAPSSSAFGY